MNDEIKDTEVVDEEMKDEELVEETSADVTEEDATEEAADLEAEMAANKEEVDAIINAEATPEWSDLPVDINVEESMATTLEEDAEELTASGESLIGMAEEAEVEEIVATEDVDHEEARAEVEPEGDIAKADEDTPLTDALLDAGEFISSPAEGDNADLDVEKIEDDKDPFDYDSAASYDEIGDELEGSAESWGKYL